MRAIGERSMVSSVLETLTTMLSFRSKPRRLSGRLTPFRDSSARCCEAKTVKRKKSRLVRMSTIATRLSWGTSSSAPLPEETIRALPSLHQVRDHDLGEQVRPRRGAGPPRRVHGLDDDVIRHPRL